MKKWKVVKKESGPDLIIFKTEFHHSKHPLHGDVLKAVVLQARETTNVVAITKEQQIVLVRQYRFGTQSVLTELPAGIIDAGEQPLEAAKRELAEETGFVAGTWTSLGHTLLNPAYLTNGCFHYLAEDVEWRPELKKQDHFEHLESFTIALAELEHYLQDGLIKDAISQVAIHKALTYLKRRKK